MIRMNFNLGTSQTDQFINNLRSIDKKIVKETNKVALKSKEKTALYASSEYYIDSTDVKEAIKVTKSSKSNPLAHLKVRGRRFSMIRFKVQSSPNSPLKIGVKKGNMKVLKRAYLAKGKNGIKHVFRRKYSLRYPIDVVRTVSIPQMLGTEKAQRYFETEIINELDQKISGILRGI